MKTDGRKSYEKTVAEARADAIEREDLRLAGLRDELRAAVRLADRLQTEIEESESRLAAMRHPD